MQANFKTNFKRQFLFATGGGALAVCALATLTLVIRSDLRERIAAIQAARSELRTRTEAVNSLVRLKQEFTRAAPYTAELQSILPTLEHLVEVPSDVEEQSRSAGVPMDFSFVGEETPATNDQPGSLNFQFTLTKQIPLTAFASFLKNVESRPYLLEFNLFDLQGTGRTLTGSGKGKAFTR